VKDRLVQNKNQDRITV